MGVPVTVDSDDLEKVVMATGVIKQIDHLIRQQKSDPFVPKDETSVAQAHERLAAEMRRAKRSDVHPRYNEPLNKHEYWAIACLMDPPLNEECNLKSEEALMGYEEFAKSLRGDGGSINPQHPAIQSIVLKGMVEAGAVFEVIFWGNSQTNTKTDLGHFAYRVNEVRAYPAMKRFVKECDGRAGE